MRREQGFTLVELMVAVTILVIISGTVYTAFNSSLNVYRRESGRLVALQKVRIALDDIARDLSNLFYVGGDQDFLFQAEDVSDESGERDTITFVTLLDPSPDPFLAQLYPEEESSVTTNEETTQATSDLVRVVYMLGIDPELGESEIAEEAGQPLSLLRVVSRVLNLEDLTQGMEDGVSALYEAEQAALQSGEQPETHTEVVVDNVTSLDFKFFDGEEWIETWEEEGIVPQAVQVLLTVADEQDPTRQVTQSTMSHFVMVPDTETQAEAQTQAMNQAAGNQNAGNPQQGGPAGGPGGGR